MLWGVCHTGLKIRTNIFCHGNPLQYSCLENPMDSGAWQAVVHEVARIKHD